MKKIVVDASVCLKWVFEEEDSPTARKLLREFLKGNLLLVAPNLWEYEIVNALASAVRRKKITASKSHQLLKFLIQAKPETTSINDLLVSCLGNGQRYDISAYDSAYLTLAAENKMLLVSADEKLVSKIDNPKIAVNLQEF